MPADTSPPSPSPSPRPPAPSPAPPVQENHHCALTFAILRSRGANVLEGLPPDEWRAARRLLIDTILATDMGHHYSLTQVGPRGGWLRQPPWEWGRR